MNENEDENENVNERVCVEGILHTTSHHTVHTSLCMPGNLRSTQSPICDMCISGLCVVVESSTVVSTKCTTALWWNVLAFSPREDLSLSFSRSLSEGRGVTAGVWMGVENRLRKESCFLTRPSRMGRARAGGDTAGVYLPDSCV